MGFRFFEETRFKETEIGLIPEDWEVVRLGEVAESISNGITKKQNKNKIGYIVTRIETISDGKINIEKVGFVENLSDIEINKFRLREGDILISHINSEPQLGNCAIYSGFPELIIHGMNLLRIRVKQNKTFPFFIFYLFRDFKHKGIFISLASRAVNQSSINQQKFKGLQIPLPPLSEQKAIAEVLQAIQEAKEKTEAVIKATRELKKSMMKQLFSYGVNRVNELRVDRVRELGVNGVSRVNRVDRVGGVEGVGELKETEIGLIPKHWQVVRLGDYCNFTTGKLNSNQAVSNGLYPFFTCSQETYRIDSYSFDCEAILLSGNNARGIYSVKYYKGKFDAYQRTYVITIKDVNQLNYFFFEEYYRDQT